MEYTYRKEFLNILIDEININSLNNLYKLNSDDKYTIIYILDILLSISTQFINKYKLPDVLSQYLSMSNYRKYTISMLKEIIKNQILQYNDYNNYIIIGKEIPIIINELTVTII
jgi:hypothetical protein